MCNYFGAHSESDSSGLSRRKQTKGPMKTIVGIVFFAQMAALASGVSDVELISRAPQASTTAAHGSSAGATFSPDGRFVTFPSTAADLVNFPGDGKFHLYLADRTTGTVQL